VVDFNEIASPNDKLGSPAPSVSRSQRLNNFLNRTDAEAIQILGNIFTWKKQLHNHLIYERLDIFIARNDWAILYPNVVEIQEVFTCFNHCPIIVAMHLQHFSTKTFPIRFQNFWCKVQNVKLVISKV